MKFMLSVGKLSHLAQLHETDAQLDDSVLDGTFVSYHFVPTEIFRVLFSIP